MGEKLQRSLKYARDNCGFNEVWCITRFDRDDKTLEIYWSEKTVGGATTSATLGSDGRRRAYGGHAECMMVRDFARAVQDYGKKPETVEIFLSRSPCLSSPAFDFDGINFPTGCARKIHKLIQENPCVKLWDIRYDDIYWGNLRNRPNPESDVLSGSVHGLRILGSLKKVSVHQFNELDVL